MRYQRSPYLATTFSRFDSQSLYHLRSQRRLDAPSAPPDGRAVVHADDVDVLDLEAGRLEVGDDPAERARGIGAAASRQRIASSTA